jgi:hypothetical protein
MARREGVNRLSVAVAVVTPVVVFFFILFASNPPAAYLWRVAALALVCGFLAWGLVKLIAWVIDGFGTSPH